MEAKEKRKVDPKLILLILLVVLLVGALVWFVLGRGGSKSADGNGNLISFDESAQNGNLPGKTDEEIQDALNKVVEEGMFNISISPEIVFADGTSRGLVRIENIQANRYHMQVTITLDDSGRVVYQSGAIKPGQYIEYINLTTALSAGTYSATATFTALNQLSLEKIGTAAAKISIVVEK